MESRTNIDFSKHEVTVIKHDGILIHHFKRPETTDHMLTFINACGVMTVTGDFGNWVFSREFHPTANNESDVDEYYVDDCYWDEQLMTASNQDYEIYDAKTALKEIKEFKENFHKIYKREMDWDEQDWIESLERNVDDEISYRQILYFEKPSTIDSELIPYGKYRHYWLEAIYDGFDALCEALRKKETENITNQKK